MRRRLRGRFLVGACVALLAVPHATSAMAGVVPRALYDKAAREGTVRVIVQLHVPITPEGALQSTEAVASQRQDIAAMRSALMAELIGAGHRAIREFTTIPFVALEVTPDAMTALEASPNVVGVEEDRLENIALSQSVPLIGANQAWATGADGTGSVVAILDTGVDKTHPFLSGKVVREACFSTNKSCPNGQASQIGSGAGVPCAYAPDGCRHGTHVAGIVAGSGAGSSGVAKGAGIIAVQVFSRLTGTICAGGEDPCALASVSDLIAGLEHIFSLRGQLAIAAVNLSVGGSTKFTSPCDSTEAARKAAIDNLRSVGIATVVASGNNAFTDGLIAPACISTAVSVGSTTKSDVVSSFSNSAPFLSLLAPGEPITSSVPGGGFAVGGGTSQATPHVAGAWAILKQKKPSATVAELLTALRNTGLVITDPRNNVTTPRIQVYQALQAMTPSIFALSVTAQGGGTGSVTSSVGGITCGVGNSGTCAASLTSGTGVTLTAAATGGATFAGWGGDCAAFGTASTCPLTMNAAKTVSATFTPTVVTGRQLLNVVTLSDPGGSEQRTFLTTDPITAEAGYYDPADVCAGVAPAGLKFFIFNLEGQLILGRNRDTTGGVNSTPVAVGSKHYLLRVDLAPSALPPGDYNLVFWVEDCTAASVLVSEFYAIRVLAP